MYGSVSKRHGAVLERILSRHSRRIYDADYMSVSNYSSSSSSVILALILTYIDFAHAGVFWIFWSPLGAPTGKKIAATEAGVSLHPTGEPLLTPNHALFEVLIILPPTFEPPPWQLLPW